MTTTSTLPLSVIIVTFCEKVPSCIALKVTLKTRDVPLRKGGESVGGGGGLVSDTRVY